MDRYTLVGGVIGLAVFLASVALALGTDSELGASAIVVRMLGAGLTGYVTVLLLRNFGPSD